MELRQLRYFVRTVELGSMGRAAGDLAVVTSTLSQQIGRLENELATRLLVRTATGVEATDAGLAFFRQAQLTLRHADAAVHDAKQARLAGEVSVGFAPSTAAVVAMPFVEAMRERYPDIRLRIVENLSGHLGALIDARRLDLAILFETRAAGRFFAQPLVDERLFAIGAPSLPRMPGGARTRLAALVDLPLVLPSASHGLRTIVDTAFARIGAEPHVVLEIDGLSVLMDAVRGGIAATIQPGAATVRAPLGELTAAMIADRAIKRRNVLVSWSDDELAPAGLAARVTIRDTVRRLVGAGRWPGATLHES